jgi:putative spermidine/putrescine transport system permease protein
MDDNRSGPVQVCKFIGMAVVVFLILPFFIIIPISFGHSSLLEFPPVSYSTRWYQALWADSRWSASTATSLKLGSIVALVSAILATVTAYGLFRYRGPGQSVVRAVIMAPLVVPVIVIGVALYYLFSKFALTGTFTGLVLAHVLVTFPYGVVVISAALDKFDVRLEQAALVLGANAFKTFLFVTLPSIRSSILVTVIFCFLISFDEVVIALLLSGPETNTLPKQMWDGIRFDLSPMIAAASTILVAMTAALVFAGEVLRRRAFSQTERRKNQ